MAVIALSLSAQCAPRTQTPQTIVATEPAVQTIGTDHTVEATADSTAHAVAEPEIPLPIRAAHPLERLFEDLAAIEAGEPGVHARILQIGDSHTASDTLTAPLREQLSARFGSGGRGYLYAGKPWESYRQRHARYDSGGDWSGTLGVRRSWDPPLGLGGTRIDAVEAGAWFSRSPCSDCDIGVSDTNAAVFYLRRPGCGRFTVTWGDAQQTVDCDSETVESSIVTLRTSLENAELRVEALDAGSAFLGTSFTSDNSGVIVEGVGMNGGRADQWSTFDAGITRAEVAALDVSLVIIAFGTNEAYGSRYRVVDTSDEPRVQARLDEYAEEYATLIDRYTLDGTGAACLAVLSPDFHDEDAAVIGTTVFDGEDVRVRETPGSIGAVQRVQREVAEAHGCAIWNTQTSMGGAGSMSVWRAMSPALGSADGVHLTTAGYTAISRRLGADLMAAFDEWLLGEPAVLRTTEAVPGVAAALAELQ